MKLEGSRIVLTGAASGIGFALLKRLAGIPCRVVAIDKDDAQLHTMVNKIISPAGKVSAYAADMGERGGVDRAIDFAISEMGGIDIFIANAGFAYYEAFGKPDWAHIESIFRVNTISPLYALAKMTQLHSDGSPFQVVITASSMAKLGLAGYALYASTKAALDRFADSYAQELPPNATLTLAYPIATRTAFFSSAASQLPATPWPSQTPEYVADQLVLGIDAGKREIYPSLTFRVMWAINRVIPVTSVYQAYTRGLFDKWRTGKR
ncbi:MAG: SDR family NAD(P)-dependent oxidoreductase [Pleurocapsa minor GSE-CHR-MK-17-07R]|jgi:short-subunit dehydrogenase|nr:SDR family NAD(P)-dependent oxidoreductase [Pleurocapsa minor GSE-CHR-MK 17-07R]